MTLYLYEESEFCYFGKNLDKSRVTNKRIRSACDAVQLSFALNPRTHMVQRAQQQAGSQSPNRKSPHPVAHHTMKIGNLLSCARTFGARRFSAKAFPADLVLVREENGVRNIILNNPTKRNVLSLDMVSAISHALTDDPSLRCLLITAHGNVFSAGHDLPELQHQPRQGQVLKATADLMIQLRDLSVPTVAKVSGAVVAAGMQLMASCDIVMASSCSTFSTPGVNLSVGCLTPIIAVSRSANVKASAFMLLTGKPVTAEQALTAGLITAHCPKQELDAATDDVIQCLVQKSRPVLALGKAFFYQQLDMSLEAAYEDGCRTMSRNIQHPDAQKGIDAFVRKQKPVWTHDPW